MDSTQDYGCCGICLCVQVVKELLSQGADPNLPLTKGLGTALCVVCDLVYEQQRSIDNKIALVRGRVGGSWAGGSVVNLSACSLNSAKGRVLQVGHMTV